MKREEKLQILYNIQEILQQYTLTGYTDVFLKKENGNQEEEKETKKKMLTNILHTFFYVNAFIFIQEKVEGKKQTLNAKAKSQKGELKQNRKIFWLLRVLGRQAQYVVFLQSFMPKIQKG